MTDSQGPSVILVAVLPTLINGSYYLKKGQSLLLVHTVGKGVILLLFPGRGGGEELSLFPGELEFAL
jgi:hypothetical protein